MTAAEADAAGLIVIRTDTPSRPMLLLTPKEFEELPEYSCTFPDSYKRPLDEGGKRWKRRWPYQAEDHEAFWSVGEYFRSPALDAKKLIGIRWYDVEIVKEIHVPIFRGRVATYPDARA